MGILANFRLLFFYFGIQSFLVFPFVFSAIASSWEDQAVEMFRHSISVPTVKGRGRVPELAQYFAAKFVEAGIPKEDVRVLPYESPDASNKTAALIVRWRAAKPTRKPVMLMGHLDVVEALSQDWGGKDPFVLREEKGYFYGRGTSDMKGGVVAVATAVLRLKKEGFASNRDIVVFFTGDEEGGTRGAELGANDWWPLLDAEYGLNADGGGALADRSGRVLVHLFWSEEKTTVSFELSTVNRGGHSSKPRPDNAIYELSQALLKIQNHQFTPKFTRATREYFEFRAKQATGPLKDAIEAWLKDPANRSAADKIESNPEEVGHTRTTCVATQISGGHAENALPQLAKATINCRLMPGENPDGTLDELKKTIEGTGASLTRLKRREATVLLPFNREVWDAVEATVHEKDPGVPVVSAMSTGASDARPFGIKGIPVMGVDGTWLVNPDDLRMHGQDERVAVASFISNLDYWYRLVKKLCQGAAPATR